MTLGGSFFIQPLSGPEEGWGMRPVINLQKLNAFMAQEHYKMEGLHLLSLLVQPADWFTKVDLKDA